MRCFFFYIDDWLSSKQIAKMDAHEERGYLRLILAAASENGPPSLPDDDEELAILSKLGSQWWKPTKDKEHRIGEQTSGKKLRECWLFRPESAFAGRVYNEKLYDTWRKHKTFTEAKSRAGKSGANRRWQKNGTAMATPSQSDSPMVVCMYGDSSLSLKSTTEEESQTRADVFEDCFWVRWVALTRRAQRKSLARAAWLSVVTPATETAAMACLERYGLSGEVRNGAVTNPDKWIYDQARDNFTGEWQPQPETLSSAERKSKAMREAVAKLDEEEESGYRQ